MGVKPIFEPLEDRIVLDGDAAVTIEGPADIQIGQDDVNFTLTFDNISTTETGYVPFIDLVLPTNGEDGYDGVEFDGVTFLGASVVTTEIVFDASGEAEHPLAVDTSGDPVIVTGTPGDTLVVIELPYGSFSAGNPAVDLDVTLDFSDLADLNSPFSLSATGGFAFGCDPLDNPADDPSSFGATDTFVVNQQLLEITKVNDAPEEEHATGPSYQYTHTITVDVAPGQTLSDFDLVDNLPPEMVYQGGLTINGVAAASSTDATVTTEPTVGPAGPGNNVIALNFPTISGSTVVTFDYYIADVPAGSAVPIIDPATGDPAPVANTVTGTGDWDPLDPNDPTIEVTDSATDNYIATSLAIQKSGTLINNDAIPDPTPGDEYLFTVNVQVSDYFTYGDLLVTDTLGNGFGFVAGSAELISVVEDDGSLAAPISLTGFETTSAGPNAGETTNVWDISAAMQSAGLDGFLTGDDVDGVFDGSNTTFQLQYRGVILDQYTDDGTLGDVEVSQGDILRNDVTVSGTVRNNADPTSVIGTEENNSSTEVQLPFGSIREKSVYALNGLPPGPDTIIAAGDTVTWRVVYDAPLGSFEDLRIADNLPQNVFQSGEVTTWISSPTDNSVPPPAGSAQYGPADTFAANGGGDPTLNIDAANNGVEFIFNNLSVDPRAPVTIEILFTVTVEDAIFADDLLLTNQATAFESNTFSGSVDTTAIAQFTYAEPVLNISKGVIADNSPDPATTYINEDGSTSATPVSPVSFSAPGTAGVRFAGSINSDNYNAEPDELGLPINSDIFNVDAGDLVSFAIVVENTGRAPNGAFNIVIEDTLPAGFEIPTTGAGLNLTVTDGSGTRPITFTGDLFTTGIELDDRGPEGALSAYDPTAGDNIVIITYDLIASDSVTSNDFIQNTATLSNYTAFEGDATNVPIDRTPEDLTDTAFATVEDVQVEKTLLDREFGEGGASEVLVGEEFTFTVRFDIQEATYENAIVSDTVRTGAAFGDYEILSATMTDWNGQLNSSNGITLGTAGSVAADGNSVSFDLGTLINSADQDASNDYFEFEVTARSLASDGEIADARLANQARFAADGVDARDNAGVDLTEPVLTLDKTAGPSIVRAGETVSYSVDVDNVAGFRDAPAYDLVLTDVLDPNVTLDVGSVTVLIGGVDVTAMAVVTGNTAGDTTIRIEIDQLDEGVSLEIDYTATVIPDVEAAVVIDNTADLTFDSLPTDDADDERDYSLTDDASVVSASPSIDKTIVATSNDDTAGTDLAIGETVTYEITIQLPEGESTDAVFVDTLPTTPGTLTYVSSEIIRIGNAAGTGNITGSALAVGASGTNVGADTTFNFGDLLNAVDLTIDDSDEIVIRVTAILTDLADNQSGETLTNTGTFTTENVSVSDTADIDVVEPSLDIDKSVTPTTADAGDTVTYMVTSTNNGTGPAYDIVIDDLLDDAGLEAGAPAVASIAITGPGTIPTGADAPSVAYPTGGGGLQAIAPVLLPGQTITITYEAVVTDDAEFDGSVDNTAQVTRYDSDPAGDTTDPDDGRVYDENLAGYTVPEDDASVDTPAPSISKTVTATDDPNTVGTDVGISEIITYDIRIDIPEGTSNVLVSDNLPTGLIPVSATISTYDDAAMTSNLVQGDDETSTFITIGADGGYVFDFGALTNTGDNNTANDFIIITVEAQVDDIVAVVDGLNLENTATLALVDPLTGDPLIDPDTGNPQTYTDTADVDVVVPELDIDKAVTPTTADAGDTVTYTITSENIGTGPAYDIIIDDPMDDIGLSIPTTAVATISIVGGTAPTGADVPTVTYPTTSDGLRATIPVLLPGQEVVIEFEAVITDAAEFSGDIDNTAEVTRFDTDPEGNGTDADNGRVFDDGLSGYTPPSDDAEVTTPDVGLSKDYFASSDANTSDGAQEVGIGETVTYRLTIDIPQGSGDLVLTDVLPAGLTALSAEVISIGTGGNTTTDNLIVGDTDASGFITIAAGGGSVEFDFGTVVSTGTDDAAATGETLVVEIISAVGPDAANVQGVDLTNTATLSISDPITGDPLQPDVVSTETVTIVEPNLTIEKSGTIAANPGDVLNYQIELENTGDGPAYDVFIEDVLGDPLLSLVSGTITLTFGGPGTPPTPVVVEALPGFNVTLPYLLPDQTLLIEYDVQLDPSADDAESFPNLATVDYDTVPGSDPSDPPGRDYSDDDDHSVATVPYMTKTATGTEFTETGDAQYDPDNFDLNVGEEVTYTFDIYLPEIPMDTVVVVDTLPAGLQYVSSRFVSAGAGLVLGTADGGTNVGQDTTFDFGAVTNPSDGTIGADDIITVEIVALVLDVPGTTDDGDTLTNTATLDVTAGPTTFNQLVAEEVIDIVDPNVTIDKTGPDTGEPSDIITYTLSIENEGTGPAYNTIVSDQLLDPNLNFQTGTVNITWTGTPASPPVTASGDGFQFTLPVLLPGQTVDVTYQVEIDPGAAATLSYVNTANVDYDSAPAGDGRAGSDSDDHAVATGPSLEKTTADTSITATDDANGTSGTIPDLVIGEEVTFSLLITLPEIDMSSVVLVDTLPDGLQFVSGVVDSTGIAGATATASALGQQVTFDFGAISNPSDGSIGADDQIVVLVTALVTDDIANADGVVWTNNATLDVTPDGESPFTQVTGSTQVEIVEPNLTIAKDGPIAVNPGDTVSYAVVIENTGTGPAADILLVDAFDQTGFLAYDSGSLTVTMTPATGPAVVLTPTVTETATGFEVTIPELLAGAQLDIAYTATLSASAPAANSFPNTASIEYDTVPDGDPNSPTGREDDAEDDHIVATIPVLSKDATSSSLSDTGSDQGDSDFLDLNIGEEVTYTLLVTLPEIDLDSVILEDTLPTGLSFVSASVVDYAGIVPAGAAVITNTGQVTEFDFGALSNPSDGSLGADDVITVELVARVENITSNTAITQLTNTATLDMIAAGGVPLDQQTAEETVEVVEPELEIEKTGPLALNPGQTGTYTLTITNTGSGAAYDTLIADAVADVNLLYQAGTVNVTLGGVPQTVVVDESGTGFETTVAAIAAGETVVVTYDVTLSPDATPVESFINTASIAYDNVPGDADPTGSSRPQTADDDHRVATIPTLTKTPIATSNPDTGRGEGDPGLFDLHIGEEVTYELVLTLPEILMDVQLVDTLPTGMSFVSSTVTSVGAGMVAGAPTVTVAGQDVIFDFGDVDNPYDGSIGADDVITIEVTAVVTDTLPQVVNGATLTNEAALTVTPDGGTPLETQRDTASIDIVEPALDLQKTVSDLTPIVGDTITYTLVLTNTGNSPSYNVTINDPLPFEMSLTGAITISDEMLATVTAGMVSGETELIISIPRLMPGESVTIDYDVFIGFQSDVLTGLTNTADAGGSSDPNTPDRGRPVGDDDSATIVADPIPLDEDPGERIPHLGIDDELFLPVLTIDPIYSGTAEPGSNVTVSLYRDDGSLTYSRHILADAGGHWIAIFPRVEYDILEEDFWDFYSGSNVFDAPVRMVDSLARDVMGFTGDGRDLVVGQELNTESYYLQLSTDRPSTLPQENGMFNARTFYATAHQMEAFDSANTLKVDEIFENIAADTVERLYVSSTDPLGYGLNRFNYEFLSGATATPGSAY